MVTSCSVFGCTNNRKKDKNSSYFRLPNVISTDETTQNLSTKRRELWLARINRQKLSENQLAEINSTLHVCSYHFVSGRPSKLFESSNPDWAPSLHLGYSNNTNAAQSEERFDRRQRRTLTKLTSDSANAELKHSLDEDQHPIGHNDNIENNKQVQTDLFDLNAVIAEREQLQQQIAMQNEHVKMLNDKLQAYLFTEERFRNNSELVTYYTGLADFNSLMALYKLIKSDIAVKRGCLGPFPSLVLCLMRLRLGVGVVDLADRFKISKTAVSKTFLRVLNILYIKLSPLIYWPERPELIASMPMCYRVKFGTKITTIIDCFEIFVDRPSNLSARALTWSSYKHHNTVKYLIAITPQGTVCFISKGWGGRVSDQHLTENSGFLKHLMHGDVVMADRGFNIAETLGSYGTRLEIPSFTKGKTQLRAEEIEETRTIANVRIHVERVIGNLRKKYSILDQTLPIDFLLTKNEDTIPTIDKIVHTTCALINMCPSVVPME